MYVLVLGLDIIGNPFGLVRDLSAGVEDLFYQPFQGLIQGPEVLASRVRNSGLPLHFYPCRISWW